MINDFYKNLPKKRMGAGILLFNKNGEILIIKPNYKNHWSIPGGIVEENESPRMACIRETKEEINIELDEIQFLCVDYTTAGNGKNESLQFIFHGGVLNEEQKIKIKLANDEIDKYKFIKIEEALPLLSEKLQKRIPKCLEALKNNTAIYLEDAN